MGANPLQMALVASAIANHGVEMVPHLVREVRDPSGRVVERVGAGGVRTAHLAADRRRDDRR